MHGIEEGWKDGELLLAHVGDGAAHTTSKVCASTPGAEARCANINGAAILDRLDELCDGLHRVVRGEEGRDGH